MSTDIFLQLDGIAGECTDAKHTGWIEISSWGTSWEQPISQAKAATGPSIEKCKHEPITVAKIMDSATPAILKHVWGGKIIKEGVISCWRALDDSSPLNYLNILMQHIIIATYSINGGEGEMPGEELALSCGYMKFVYKKAAHGASADAGSDTGNMAAEINRVTGAIDGITGNWEKPA